MIVGEADAREWVASLASENPIAMVQLDRLCELLRDENTRQNLIAASTVPAFWRRHIADSAQLTLSVPRETHSWLDIGSGAGLPGLVVAVLLPQTQVAMVEPRTRRVDWLERAFSALGLTNVSIVPAKLERVETRTFDVISARAVARLDALVAMAARFSTTTTIWRLPKGRSAQEELQNLAGWEHTFHVEQSLTEADGGIISGHLLGETRCKP